MSDTKKWEPNNDAVGDYIVGSDCAGDNSTILEVCKINKAGALECVGEEYSQQSINDKFKKYNEELMGYYKSVKIWRIKMNYNLCESRDYWVIRDAAATQLGCEDSWDVCPTCSKALDYLIDTIPDFEEFSADEAVAMVVLEAERRLKRRNK